MSKTTKGFKEEAKQEVVSYGYYSKLLNKPFDTLDELKQAEDAYHKANEEKIKLAEEKREDAKKVEDAYKHLLEVQKKAQAEIKEAEDMYLKERNSFIQKHNGYHMTYTNRNGEETLNVSDLIDSFFACTPFWLK